jgi:hypothetical protein
MWRVRIRPGKWSVQYVCRLAEIDVYGGPDRSLLIAPGDVTSSRGFSVGPVGNVLCRSASISRLMFVFNIAR